MPRICYTPKSFRADTLAVISQADAICAEYAAQGFTLTLRQLYYQFVARGLIPNRDTEYKRLGSIINDARLAGLLDWDYLEDRTRNLRSLAHWADPREIIDSAEASFRLDKWDRQLYRPEVWIEKDALVGVIEGVCQRNDVPFFSCRGYTSQSEMWGASQRLLSYIERGQAPIIFHLGDHDPSGIDMTRDITDRLDLFIDGSLELHRLALNMDQVTRYGPPPNPAKQTDSRFAGYINVFGAESWELDALEPQVIADLIDNAIDGLIDHDVWAEVEREQVEHKAVLRAMHDRWADVRGFLERGA